MKKEKKIKVRKKIKLTGHSHNGEYLEMIEHGEGYEVRDPKSKLGSGRWIKKSEVH